MELGPEVKVWVTNISRVAATMGRGGSKGQSRHGGKEDSCQAPRSRMGNKERNGYWPDERVFTRKGF